MAFLCDKQVGHRAMSHNTAVLILLARSCAYLIKQWVQSKLGLQAAHALHRADFIQYEGRLTVD